MDPEGALVEAVVDPGQTKEVSEVIKGGTKITLKFASRTCPDSPGFLHHRAYGEAKVAIDGNVTVRLLPPVALNIPVTTEVM